ncbi:hypothetical protein HPHPH9_0019 [Helicobacter pylori Hp H-9]|nr:hypothetical protein HPHPH9_0019 [Helicobacter pylori Hp H-9]
MKRQFLRAFPKPKTLKSFFKKAGLSLSFGAFSCGYLKSLVRDAHSFKQALSVF